MEGLPEDMWSPYKRLYRVIEETIANSNAATIAELEICLKKYKQNFSTILGNPPKNERSRNQIRNGITDSVSDSGHSRNLLLSKDLVDESIIISDMFDLNEFIALELLCTAQRQMSLHPGLPRGLVAILLYYDGRKAISYSLRDLFQVTSGVSWVTDIPKEVTHLISSFTQCLVDDSNILGRIIDLLEELDITKECVLLTKNRAFGPQKHQNQIIEIFEDIRLALATSLFNWSAQRGLPKFIVVKLIQNLYNYKSSESSGAIDDVTLTMLMALLYSYDTSVLRRQEENILMQNLPVLNEPDFLQQVYDALISDKLCDSENGIHGVAKFAYGLTLASLRQAPQNLQNSFSKAIERDEQLVDDAIANKTFDFIYSYILEKDIIFRTEFFYRRLHMLLTDFIDFMHSKVTELRGRADETSRTVLSFVKEGLEPPSNIDHNFEMLMLCIGKLYKHNRAGLSLCVEYWGPLDISSNYSKTTTRSVSLFKFIRLAGELLPATLFVPYLKMIAGLTSCERSARNTFNLLKQSSGLSGSATLSWEHFFGSLTRYYSNLRQEQCHGVDITFRNRPFSRTINPHEIEGLHAVLGVIKAVATYDECARIAMCEHPNWAPLHVLLGLLSCSVPLSLKAEILRTLSALSKSKETAISLWNNLEASQIIETTATSAYNTCNLEVEIDQNECRVEVYELSQSVLDFLYSLITTYIPKHLGGGPRKPGFYPYLNFIIKGIFLKFYNRSYKNTPEKWQVGEKCLKIIHFMLNSYEVSPQDFDEHIEETPPGYHIMLQLHTKSDMMRLLLIIIDEARLKLDEYNKFQGKEDLEECALYCLKILEIGLTKQDVFYGAHSIANSSILLSGLNKILLDVNPRSRRPDHILNTTKFITYCSWLPSHSLVAVKILNLVSKLPNVNSQMLGIFGQNDRTESEIRQGFVECLETQLMLSASHVSDEEDEVPNRSKTELQIKKAIIELLQDCLLQPAPNISHFLLGFDTTKAFQINQKQTFSVIESVNNCTKSLVSLLDNHLEMTKTTDMYNEHIENVIERSYYLLLSLCENQKTSDIILRYLRSCNDFLSRHIISLPFRNYQQSSVLTQMSHLLKCSAIELKITASNCQISRFQHLCKLMVGTPKIDHAMTSSHYYPHSTYKFAEAVLNDKNSEKSSNMLLCHLLDCFEFEVPNQSSPKWIFFDNSMLEKIFNECEIKTEQGHKIINIKKLHQILNEELHMVQSSIATGQRQLILQEIESMLIFALKYNDGKYKSFATVKLMEAWGQVTEILFMCAPESAMSIVTKQELVLEILQKILCKVVPIEPIIELSILASETILLLLVNLRYYFTKKLENAGNYDNLITSSLNSENDPISSMPSSKSNTLSLKFILKKILDWIIVSGVSSQKLRINLYAALLNCLRIVKGNCLEQTHERINEFYVSRLDNPTKQEKHYYNESNQIRMSVEVVLSFGDKLIDIICNDCIVGHDICKITALSCIDAILDMDSVSGFVTFIANRGYLSHIIESLIKCDENLCRILGNLSESMKCLYVYESKMALLLRLSTSFVGAELLLTDRILSILSCMKAFDMHPDFQSNTVFIKGVKNNFLPPLDSCFRQILFPALNLCDSIISTLGSENHSAISQVMGFLLSHCDMLEMVLRAGSPYMELGLLQELSAITGLIARATNQKMYMLGEQISNTDAGVNLYRIHRVMLCTFTRFIINESTFEEMLKPENVLYEPTEANKDLHIKYFLEISSNLALYCRNAIANHSADHRANGILFSPKLTELIQREDNSNNSLKTMHSLGVIINQLKGSVEYFNSQRFLTDNLLRQRSSWPNISFDSAARNTFVEVTQQHTKKIHELALCTFITEQCLYILWTHLDFYMGRTFANTEHEDFIRNGLNSQEIPLETTISPGDIGLLKKSLISVFNETFCKQLLISSEWQSETEKGFNEALLRRIKNLIQFAPF